MREQLIEFETAKLAKEKRFYAPTVGSYSQDNIEDDNFYLSEGVLTNYNAIGMFSAPTQSLLQKWLREEHDIHIMLEAFDDGSWQFWLINPKFEEEDDELYQKTYEEALEKGLIESLKLIK